MPDAEYVRRELDFTYYSTHMQSHMNDLLYAYDASGSVIGMEYNGAKYWYDKNLQGDIVGIRNSAGTLVAQYVYDAWGRISKSPMARATMCPPTHPTSPISTRSDTGGTTTTWKRDGTTSTADTTTPTSAGSSARMSSSAPTAACRGIISSLTATTILLCLPIRVGGRLLWKW